MSFSQTIRKSFLTSAMPSSGELWCYQYDALPFLVEDGSVGAEEAVLGKGPLGIAAADVECLYTYKVTLNKNKYMYSTTTTTL